MTKCLHGWSFPNACNDCSWAACLLSEAILEKAEAKERFESYAGRINADKQESMRLHDLYAAACALMDERTKTYRRFRRPREIA